MSVAARARMIMLCVGLAGAHAEAAPPQHAPPAPPIDVAQANALYPVLREAYSLYEMGRFDAAVVAFERAYAISPEPRFVLNVALSHRDAGRCAQALGDLERFFGVCAACPQREAARGVLTDTQRQCTPMIEFRTQPISALITVDGEARGSAPLKVALAVGPHVVSATAAGHQAVERALLVKSATPASITLTLSADALTPIAALEPASAMPPGVEPASTQTDMRSWAWGAWTTAGVGAIAGGAFGLLLLDDLDRESKARSRAEQREAQADARRNALITQAGLGVALTGAALGLTLMVLDDDGVEVRASAGGGALALRF